jgi:Fe-S cluster assembly protein SufD
MITEPKSEQDAFQALLWSFYSQVAVTDSLQRIRAKAWDHFLELGLPSRNEEVYRYVRLRNFFSRTFALSHVTAVGNEATAPHIYPECTRSCLVFVNGHYSPTLSNIEGLPKRVVVVSLSEATRTFGSFLNNQWAKSLKEEVDPFAALNAAMHRDGVFLYLPPKTYVETPIQVLHLMDMRDAPMLIMPRLNVFAGTQSQLTLVSTQATLSGSGYAINQVADFAIEEGAQVHYMQANCGIPDDVWHFDAMRASLKRDGKLKTASVTDGSATVRNDYRVLLVGENAEALLNGIWMLNGKREAHTHVIMDHQAPYCRSMQLYKGALNDMSHSSFEGKILVRQPAQKTEAFQLNNNLLLSDRANAESKPNLEIFADDVKASHGATVGQLDNEQIFYMKTRGFSEADAKNLLVYGFCREVIDLIEIPSLRDKLTKFAERYMIG